MKQLIKTMAEMLVFLLMLCLLSLAFVSMRAEASSITPNERKVVHLIQSCLQVGENFNDHELIETYNERWIRFIEDKPSLNRYQLEMETKRTRDYINNLPEDINDIIFMCYYYSK